MTGNLQIQVLLATYNGEKYLPEFLDSLLRQDGVDIHLIVSDDGSTDTTLQILNQFRSKFFCCEIFDGPKSGPSNNFDFLISNRKTNLPVAFADQDDVWLPNKIIEMIEGIDLNLPTLLYGPVLILGSGEKYPRNLTTRKFGHYFSNKAMGCSQIMTASMCEKIEKTQRPEEIHFDWWNYIVATEISTLRLVAQPYVNYRLHSSNVIGIPTRLSRLARYFINVFKNKSIYSREFISIFNAQEQVRELKGSSSEFELFQANLNTANIFDAIKEKYFRESYFENIFVCLLITLYVFKKRFRNA